MFARSEVARCKLFRYNCAAINHPCSYLHAYLAPELNTMIEKNPMFMRFKSARERIRSLFPGLFVFGKGMTLLYSSRSVLRTSGYFKSVATKKPCLNDGSPIP